MTAEQLVRLDRVTKKYGEHVVLRDVDLEVRQHEVITLIGASGSGKSTLLRCVNGLEEIQGGRILFDGDVVSGPGVDLVALRRQVGMVFQSFNLFPHMSVLKNCTVAPVQNGQANEATAKAAAMEMLERVGLADKAESFPDRLSGGQQQRVAIARSLLMQPRLLLLDEITSALDPELVVEVLDLVRELARGGMTMILTTHEMSFAREISDRVCFLSRGTIIEQGPPEQIFGAPVEAATQQFLRRVTEAGRL